MSGFHFERPSSIPFGVFSSNGTTSASGFSSPFGSFASPPANTGPSTFGFSPVGVNSGNHASSNAASATSTFGAATARRSPSGRTNSTAPTSKNEAARSEIFKNMLDSDGCKAPPSDTDTITLSELNNEELESLLEFLYTGNLPLDKLEKHVYSLYVAADKYEIPYLQESCESYMLNSLNASNAIDILEIADAQSNKTLKETTLNFIIRNMKDIVSTTKYEVFASSNPALCMQITRAFVDAKSN
ncbi:BTB/POZ domain-containing protein, putative isoform 4 [Theobroma cacao]|uniref:BTB/POZ domain-containing protein, putative isoform 4 n=1 Tax=Theobroma cacao TaxID=3641 RepID=A0A061FSD6_THECC|nr:BTB/POZ domain-containing protein, putative isoform 4 [Theobroma cacao]